MEPPRYFSLFKLTREWWRISKNLASTIRMYLRSILPASGNNLNNWIGLNRGEVNIDFLFFFGKRVRDWQQSRVDFTTNIQMLLLFLLLLVLCLVAAGCSLLWSSSHSSLHWYLRLAGDWWICSTSATSDLIPTKLWRLQITRAPVSATLSWRSWYCSTLWFLFRCQLPSNWYATYRWIFISRQFFCFLETKAQKILIKYWIYTSLGYKTVWNFTLSVDGIISRRHKCCPVGWTICLFVWWMDRSWIWLCYQAIFINNDVEMYSVENDTPASTVTSNLNDELGRVKYIFSDKTGTLTQNMMEFHQMSVAGSIYSANSAAKKASGLQQELEAGKDAAVIRQFLTLLSVCNSVLPEVGEDDRQVITYHASSPGSFDKFPLY